LTSKTFPLDAWVETAGYVSNAAVLSGMYMDRLDTKQSLALCLVDLAKGFEAKNKEKLSANEIDQFMQNCVELALQTAPNLITARLLQVELEARKVKNTYRVASSHPIGKKIRNSCHTIVCRRLFRIARINVFRTTSNSRT
jgi:hypothetical protein